MDIAKLSNAEISKKMTDYSNEYESIKAHIRDEVERLKELDSFYIELKKEKERRSKSFVENGKDYSKISNSNRS